MQETSSSPTKRRREKDPLLDSSGPAAERLAHLRSTFERLGARCAENLQQLAPSPIEVGLRDLVAGGGDDGDALEPYGDTAPIAVFHAPDRISRILIGADAACIDAALASVSGADGSEEPGERTEPATGIALRLGGAIFDLVAEALRSSFAGTLAAPMERERLDSADRLPAALRRGGAWLVATFGLTTLGRGGEVFVLLPQAALQGLQQSAATAAPAAPTARDPSWSKRIEQEVQRTQVTLKAVLDEQELTLGDVAELHVGQTLALRAGPRTNVKVICNDQTLFWCELGQTDGAYTLRVKDFPEEEQELIDAIFAR